MMRSTSVSLAVFTALATLHSQFPQKADGDSIITGANIRIEKFEQCPDKLDLPNTFVGTRASQSGLNDITIEGRIKVGQTIVDPASLKVTMHKCASKDAPDTCEYFYTYSTNEFCKLVGMENMPWSNFWLQTNLPRSCPVKLGNYSMNGARISLANMPNAAFLHGYWKVRSTGKSGGKTWHCAIAEFVFGPEVKKRRRGKHQG
ncbi:Hypothetical protein NTJ_05484 [Nesidiocoris tenuis]|uniref:MD-2-related lipid-recognition domain-containing protein n=1 Tax=Nesidiocoris tenuis TaxID=355587 RepID=A0ABN7AK97_9HEMI|nr:Hypothetical protein NTJ_05484 [Nesidiocoris tenuis]